MTAYLDRARTIVGFHLARVPESIIRRVTARRPIAIDGQRLDPQTQHALVLLQGASRGPLDELPLDVARREYAEFPRVFEAPPRPLSRLEDDALLGPEGDIPIRIYGPSATSRPLPALVFFHGGGGVIGSIDTHDGLCRLLCRELEALVISVDYRLAPEHPFPAAVDDALAAYRWVMTHARSLGVDPQRVAVGGDSHGGNLSAVVCQLARDTGEPPPRAQLLIYPATDRVTPTASQRLFSEGLLLTAAMIDWFAREYLAGADPGDPRASPRRHPDLRGLPPAVIVTAGFDPLRDEGRAYADALRDAGGTVRYRCWDGLVHGFAQMTGAVEPARRAVQEAAQELRALMGRA